MALDDFTLSFNMVMHLDCSASQSCLKGNQETSIIEMEQILQLLRALFVDKVLREALLCNLDS